MKPVHKWPRRSIAVLLIAALLLSLEGAAMASHYSDPSDWRDQVEMVRWFRGGDSVLRKGQCGYVYDIKSGYIIRVKRKGGHYHMDLEPADRHSAKLMKKLGRSWRARPAILYADGRFIACSINTKPHGKQSVKRNGFRGHFCLHMVGSRTHGLKRVRRDHQRAIKKAYRWAHR